MNAAQLNGNGNTDTFSDILSSAVAECLNGNDHQEDVLFDDLDELDLLANGSSESGSTDKPLTKGIPFNRTTQSVQRLPLPSQQLNMSSDSGSSTSTVGRLVSFDLSNCSIASTDHEMEAVQFLRSTLNLYGPELSIADLFSYRRRAPMTVRSLILNCGEMKALLEKYPQRFVVHGDKVRLKKPEDDLPEANLNAAGMTLAGADGTDAYTEQQYDQLMKADTIEFFGGILKKHGAMMMKIGGLFACRVQAPQAVRRSYARSEAVFSKFLFENPETFAVEGDCVSLRERMVASNPALGSSSHGYLSQAFPVQQPVLLRTAMPVLQPVISVPSVASSPFYASQPRFVSNSFTGLMVAPIASANHAQFAAPVELSQDEPLPDQNTTKSYTPWSTSVDKPDQQEAIDYFRNVLIQRDGMKMSISRLYSRHCCEAPRYIQQLAGAHSLASFAKFLADNPQAFVLPGSNFVCVKYPPISTSAGSSEAKSGSSTNASQRVKKILSIVNPEQASLSAVQNGHAGKQLPTSAKQPSPPQTAAANGFERAHHEASAHRRFGGALNQNGFFKESYGFSEVFISKQTEKANSAEQQWAKWPLAAISPTAAANVNASSALPSDVVVSVGSLTIRDENQSPACEVQANSADEPDRFSYPAVNRATEHSSDETWADDGKQRLASSVRSDGLPEIGIEDLRSANNEGLANDVSEGNLNGFSPKNRTNFSQDFALQLCELSVHRPARKVYSALEMWAIREQWLSSSAQPSGLPDLVDKEFCQHWCNFRSLFNELLPKYQHEKGRADGLAQEVLSLKELLSKSMHPTNTDDPIAASNQ